MTGRQVPPIPDAFQAVLDSDHVSSRTREVMAKRARPVEGAPRVLTDVGLERLRAVLDRVLPQEALFGTAAVDLAERVDERLAGPGDGWRFADLPPDGTAYELALETLDAAAQERYGQPLPALEPPLLDDLIRMMADGKLDGKLNHTQLQRWFGDLRADAVQAFMAHPAVQGTFAISAIATGGDTEIQGFEWIGPGLRDPWERPL